MNNCFNINGTKLTELEVEGLIDPLLSAVKTPTVKKESNPLLSLEDNSVLHSMNLVNRYIDNLELDITKPLWEQVEIPKSKLFTTLIVEKYLFQKFNNLELPVKIDAEGEVFVVGSQINYQPYINPTTNPILRNKIEDRIKHIYNYPSKQALRSYNGTNNSKIFIFGSTDKRNNFFANMKKKFGSEIRLDIFANNSLAVTPIVAEISKNIEIKPVEHIPTSSSEKKEESDETLQEQHTPQESTEPTYIDEIVEGWRNTHGDKINQYLWDIEAIQEDGSFMYKGTEYSNISQLFPTRELLPDEFYSEDISFFFNSKNNLVSLDTDNYQNPAKELQEELIKQQTLLKIKNNIQEEAKSKGYVQLSLFDDITNINDCK